MNPVTAGVFALLSPLWLVPAALCFAMAAFDRRDFTDAWSKVLSPAVYGFLGGRNQRQSSRWRWLLAAWIALAASAPAIRISDADSWRHTTAWIAIVDVSRSMTLEDIRPNRLAASRHAVLALSELAGARPMALLIYAGDAFLVSPPAFDRSLLEQQASLLEHGSVPIEGSNLTRALSLGTSIALDSGMVAARMMLIGDGAGATTAAIAAARYLKDQGHRLDVLLVANPEHDAGRAGTIDIDAVSQLASSGGGKLLMADAFGTIVFDTLDLDTDTADVRALQSVQWQSLSHWMLLPVLFVIPALNRAYRR